MSITKPWYWNPQKNDKYLNDRIGSPEYVVPAATTYDEWLEKRNKSAKNFVRARQKALRVVSSGGLCSPK